MKQYDTPTIDIIELEKHDVIATSGLTDGGENLPVGGEAEWENLPMPNLNLYGL